jgi:hypothetical protein
VWRVVKSLFGGYVVQERGFSVGCVIFVVGQSGCGTRSEGEADGGHHTQSGHWISVFRVSPLGGKWPRIVWRLAMLFVVCAVTGDRYSVHGVCHNWQ